MDNAPYNQYPPSGLSAEDAPLDLGGLELPEEGAGQLPDGWYQARILEGFSTRKGKLIQTSDAPSKDMQSRNLTLALVLDASKYVPSSKKPSERVLTAGPGGDRNMFTRLNYQPSDLTPARVAEAKAIITKMKSGYQPTRTEQSLYLSLGRVSQLEHALGFKMQRNGTGFTAHPLFGQVVDVRIAPDKKGEYQEVKAFAPAQSHVK